jgi:hypothetical protein
MQNWQALQQPTHCGQRNLQYRMSSAVYNHVALYKYDEPGLLQTGYATALLFWAKTGFSHLVLLMKSSCAPWKLWRESHEYYVKGWPAARYHETAPEAVAQAQRSGHYHYEAFKSMPHSPAKCLPASAALAQVRP